MRSVKRGSVVLGNPSTDRRKMGFDQGMQGILPCPEESNLPNMVAHMSIWLLVESPFYRDLRLLLMRKYILPALASVEEFGGGNKQVGLPLWLHRAANRPDYMEMACLLGLAAPTLLVVEAKLQFNSLQIIGSLPWTDDQKRAMTEYAQAQGWSSVWVYQVAPLCTLPTLAVRNTCRNQGLFRIGK
jgi:hypothetical protein